MNKYIFLLLAFSSLFSNLFGATTSVTFANAIGTELRDGGGVNLTRGDALTSHDGAIVQIGYYSLATTLDPFAGDWIAMTGPGTSHLDTIGDGGPGAAGRIKTTSIFTLGSIDFLEPASTTPLSVRFYDSTSLTTSSYFNAVSNITGSWNWISPDVPQAFMDLSLSDPGLVWQDGLKSSFFTTIPIPEPCSTSILLISAGILVLRRR